MSFTPTVLPPLTLPALLDHVLTAHAPSAAVPTTLLICSSRDTFLDDLLQALQHHHHNNTKLHALTTPTLFNLATTQHVTLAFCPSVQALLAHLTAYGQPRGTDDAISTVQAAAPRLFLVNPLALHAPTSFFSAQGLSRTFAAAVEAALVAGAVLTMVECRGVRLRGAGYDGDDDGGGGSGGGSDDDAGADEDTNTNAQIEQDDKDPWDQHVSILNVSARRYGSGSERAWAGRTVTARRIAATWFRFDDDHQTGDSADEKETTSVQLVP